MHFAALAALLLPVLGCTAKLQSVNEVGDLTVPLRYNIPFFLRDGQCHGKARSSEYDEDCKNYPVLHVKATLTDRSVGDVRVYASDRHVEVQRQKPCTGDAQLDVRYGCPGADYTLRAGKIPIHRAKPLDTA